MKIYFRSAARARRKIEEVAKLETTSENNEMADATNHGMRVLKLGRAKINAMCTVH